MTSIMKKEKLDVVGLRDIAVLLHVDKRTPTVWRQRAEKTGFPEEDGLISGNVPIWHRATILKWAQATGRLPTQREAKEAAKAAAATEG